MMQIKKEILNSFLKKINFSHEIILNFMPEGLKVICMNASNTAKVYGLLKPESFVSYNAIGKIGVQNLGEIINIINKFDDVIELKVDGNLLTINSGRDKMETELMNVELITHDDEFKEIEFQEHVNFNIDARIINDFINNISVNKDYTIILRTEIGKLLVTNDGVYKFTKEIFANEIDKIVCVKFGAPFIDAIKNINGQVNISIQSNYPIIIKEQLEHSVVKILVAPQVSND